MIGFHICKNGIKLMVITRAAPETLGSEYTPTSIIITGDSIEQFGSELVSAVHTRDNMVAAFKSVASW